MRQPANDKQTNKSWGPLVAGFGVLAIVLVVILFLRACSEPPLVAESSTTLPVPSTNFVAPTGTAVSDGAGTTTTIYTHPISNPSHIVIPAIDADASIVQVGVEEKDPGAMEVPPFGKAGWFKVGPAPGESGPSVIVGHVSSVDGPDVFYRLDDLEAGDEVLVYDESGDVARFVVDSTETVLKTELPTERIWNDTREPVIRLITCGGEFDPRSRHYLSNVIAYGHLVD